MKRLSVLFAVLIFNSCEVFEDNSKSYKLEEIEELHTEIIALSESVSCTNSAEWKFTPMGSKACGGPLRHIAYHQSVEVDFLDLVDQYTTLQAEYNRKYNIISDCSLLIAPRGVICEGGKPIFIS